MSPHIPRSGTKAGGLHALLARAWRHRRQPIRCAAHADAHCSCQPPPAHSQFSIVLSQGGTTGPETPRRSGGSRSRSTGTASETPSAPARTSFLQPPPRGPHGVRHSHTHRHTPLSRVSKCAAAQHVCSRFHPRPPQEAPGERAPGGGPRSGGLPRALRCQRPRQRQRERERERKAPLQGARAPFSFPDPPRESRHDRCDNPPLLLPA